MTGSAALVVQTSRFSFRIYPRPLIIAAILAIVVLIVAIFALTIGDAPITPMQAIRALVGLESGLTQTIVTNWRLPRVTAAVVFGAALALSGAMFQVLTRNPLGSPDIIGFNTGAYTGAIISIVVVGGGFLLTAASALMGGLITALVVFLLVGARNSAGLRLIIIGIAVSAMLTAVNRWLIYWGELETALSAATWGAGSLNGLRWEQVGLPVIVLIGLIMVSLLLSNTVRLLDLDDDTVTALGAGLGRSRLMLLILGVLLTAAVTALAGPIAFVALAAPQLAQRLTRSYGQSLLVTAMMGAAILLISDVLAQRLFSPIQLPAGVITVIIGGAYLIYLLIRQARNSS